MKEADVGKFIRWGAAVTIDTAEKLIGMLPISRPEDLVEIPNEDCPEDEALGLRVSSW
ncbi:MAG TPA: hypothetical protein VGB52_01695 [Actinomycetota bacterium]